MDTDFVVAWVCQNVNEASLLRSVLEGNGVEAFIPDEYTANLNYAPIAMFGGGVRLLVHKDDAARAERILRSDDQAAGE